MIEAVRGKLIAVGEGALVVETGGFQLNLVAPDGLCDQMNRLLLGAAETPEVRLTTHLLVMCFSSSMDQ